MPPVPFLAQIESHFPGLHGEVAALLNRRLDLFHSALEENGVSLDLDVLGSKKFLQVMLFSEFAAGHLTRDPGMLSVMADSRDLMSRYSPHTLENKLAAQIGDKMDPAALKDLLFQFKLYEVIRIAWRDLTGEADLEETMADLSNLACACISSGMDYLYRALCEQKGTPTDADGNFQEIIVLGMGKLGAKELNFSSDIDLIFVYPEEGYTTGDTPTSNDEFFTKLCREFIKLFSPGNGGHFYRVDTRLRPFGDSGSLVMSAAAFEHYFYLKAINFSFDAFLITSLISFKTGFSPYRSQNSWVVTFASSTI